VPCTLQSSEPSPTLNLPNGLANLRDIDLRRNRIADLKLFQFRMDPGESLRRFRASPEMKEHFCAGFEILCGESFCLIRRRFITFGGNRSAPVIQLREPAAHPIFVKRLISNLRHQAGRTNSVSRCFSKIRAAIFAIHDSSNAKSSGLLHGISHFVRAQRTARRSRRQFQRVRLPCWRPLPAHGTGSVFAAGRLLHEPRSR
jgi:hypothetical protein